MARARKTAVDPAERARQKKLRAAERRRLRKLGQPVSSRSSRSAPKTEEARTSPNALFDWAEGIPQDPKNLSWLTISGVRMAANRIMNEIRVRPYYVSIHWPRGSGVEPCFNFYPCGYFVSGDRVYYSFAFVEHRNAVFDTYRKKLKARKETRESVMRAHANR